MKISMNLGRLLLTGFVASVSTATLADVTVDKSNGQLTISSDIDGTVIAKIVGPDNVVVVDERYSGSSFSWSPSSGPDGAYRYEVRVLPQNPDAGLDAKGAKKQDITSDYAGGSVEVVNGQLASAEENLQ